MSIRPITLLLLSQFVAPFLHKSFLTSPHHPPRKQRRYATKPGAVDALYLVPRGLNVLCLGILASSGEYISFLDDDDVRLPQSLNIQMEALASAPEAELLSQLHLKPNLRPSTP